jgi:hypothetical protein
MKKALFLLVALTSAMSLATQDCQAGSSKSKSPSQHKGKSCSGKNCSGTVGTNGRCSNCKRSASK